MKVVIQRVRSANVAVDEQIVSEIGNGIVLLWGVKKGDSFEDADNIIKLPKMVKENINSIEQIKKVDLKLVWSPPWTKDMMSEEAKLELNL